MTPPETHALVHRHAVPNQTAGRGFQPRPTAREELSIVHEAPAEVVSEKHESRTVLHRLPAHTIVGCPLQLMAEVSGSAEICGTVRFFDQFGLLGAAQVDPESGVATLPYAFTSGGRRDVWAVYTGCDIVGTSRAATCTLQVYGSDRTITMDVHEAIARR